MKYISTGSFCHFGLPGVNTGICVMLDQQVCESRVTEQVINGPFHGFIGFYSSFSDTFQSRSFQLCLSMFWHGAHHFTKVQFTNISFHKSSFHKSSFHKKFISQKLYKLKVT